MHPAVQAAATCSAGGSALSVCPCCTSLQEKIERAANYARVMRELAQLGQFVRLADYLFVEAVMATAVVNVEELLGVLTAHKQQVGRPAMAESWLQRALVVGMACRLCVAAAQFFGTSKGPCSETQQQQALTAMLCPPLPSL